MITYGEMNIRSGLDDNCRAVDASRSGLVSAAQITISDLVSPPNLSTRPAFAFLSSA